MIVLCVHASRVLCARSTNKIAFSYKQNRCLCLHLIVFFSTLIDSQQHFGIVLKLILYNIYSIGLCVCVCFIPPAFDALSSVFHSINKFPRSELTTLFVVAVLFGVYSLCHLMKRIRRDKKAFPSLQTLENASLVSFNWVVLFPFNKFPHIFALLK